jgi:hypothetical protein
MVTAMLCIPLVCGESMVMVPQRTNNDSRAIRYNVKAVPRVWMDPVLD